MIELIPIRACSNAPDEKELGAKSEYMRFSNVYLTNYDPQDPEHSALEISKTVIGNYANLQLPFAFQLSLSDPVLGSLPDTVYAYIIAADGTETPLALETGGVVNNFVLRHDERLIVPTVLAGTIFWVRESPNPLHTPSATVVTGGVEVSPRYVGAEGSALQIRDNFHRVSNTAADGSAGNGSAPSNSVTFENAHRWIPPMGLTLDTVHYVAIGLSLLLLAVMSRQRRRFIETVPVVC